MIGTVPSDSNSDISLKLAQCNVPESSNYPIRTFLKL